MKKVDKCSSAGTNDDSSTNAQGSQVSQPIAKPNVSLQLVCDHCGSEKTKLGQYECKCGMGKFWIEQTN